VEAFDDPELCREEGHSEGISHGCISAASELPAGRDLTRYLGGQTTETVLNFARGSTAPDGPNEVASVWGIRCPLLGGSLGPAVPD
jgi:hypothetical protein